MLTISRQVAFEILNFVFREFPSHGFQNRIEFIDINNPSLEMKNGQERTKWKKNTVYIFQQLRAP